MKPKMLPSIVFSMDTPFSEAQVYDRLQRESHDNSNRDDGLTVDLYLENLVRYGILIQNGSLFEFRNVGQRRRTL